MFKGFIFDLDGTVYLGDDLIPGAAETIRLLRERGRQVVFLSNKPLQAREAYAAKLSRLGVPVEPSQVINSSFVLVRYLLEVAPGAHLFVIGEPPLLAELTHAGFRLTDEPEEIDYVVASFDRTFDYRKLYTAFLAIRRGARFIATNPDRTCPMEGGEYPDCAAVIAALEAVTERKVEAIMGKPSSITIEMVLSALGLGPEECLLVGDRLETDIRMGIDSGMKTALVLTGVTTRESLARSPIRPDYVLESIAGLPGLL